MRKLKEVLRLHFLGLSQHQIARSCSISQSTVHEYLSAAEAAGVKWPLPDTWDEQQIEQALFPQRSAASVWRKHPEPEWAKIHEDLQTHKNLTLQLVWHEGRESNPDGYGYSRFCDLYRRWLKKLDLVLRQEHRAGEKMFVDYAGATIPIHDAASGEVHAAAVFVAVLGASSYTFAEATTSQDLRNWIGSHTRAFEFFGGTVEVVVPDNLKSAVTHPSYYEPDLNPTYRDLGEHYGVAIIPARPYRARDKAKAEVGVQVVQRWIVAALRKRKFFSLAEVNQAIAELLVRVNQRPFRKRAGSRATLFAQLDKPALKPLPATRYQFGEWKTARVNIDYHIEVERHFYSVPYALVHREVDVPVAVYAGADRQREFVAAERSVPFDLDRAPLLRERHLSIFADQWSDWLGTLLTDHARLGDPERCRGAIDQVAAVGAADAKGWRASGWTSCSTPARSSRTASSPTRWRRTCPRTEW